MKHDRAMLAMWGEGLNTKQIADRLVLPEYVVHNRLHNLWAESRRTVPERGVA